MHAGDLTAGRYWAHNIEWCEIWSVQIKEHEIWIDYTYMGARYEKWYALDSEWSVVPAWQIETYVINEWAL